MLKFTEDHEWLDVDGDVAKVGITTYAVEQLGDVVFAEMPKLGATHAKNAEVATVESSKVTSSINCPRTEKFSKSMRPLSPIRP